MDKANDVLQIYTLVYANAGIKPYHFNDAMRSDEWRGIAGEMAMPNKNNRVEETISIMTLFFKFTSINYSFVCVAHAVALALVGRPMK